MNSRWSANLHWCHWWPSPTDDYRNIFSESSYLRPIISEIIQRAGWYLLIFKRWDIQNCGLWIVEWLNRCCEPWVNKCSARRTWNFVDFHLHSIHQHGAIQPLGSTIIQADAIGQLWWILEDHRSWQWQIAIQAHHQSRQWYPCHCSWQGRTANRFREGPQSEIVLLVFTHEPF